MDDIHAVKVAFVGVGGMGQCAHLRNYASLPGCQVVAIAELRPGLARRVADKYNVPRVYPDHAAMLASEQVDAIVASQPFTRHGTLLPELFQAGVPVFTEKPLAGSIQAGQRVLDALRNSNAWHMVGYHKRSDPATMFAKAEINRLKQSGELGPMRYVRITMPAGDWIAGGFFDLVHSDESMPPLDFDPPADDMDADAYREYVSFVNYYIHQVNLMRHLLGEPYRLAYVDRHDRTLVVETDSGSTGIIEMSPYLTSVDWQESALIAFEHGCIRLKLPAPLVINQPGTVEIFHDPGSGRTPVSSTPSLPWVHAMRQQAANFISAVRGDIEPMCTAEEAMQDLLIARDYIRLRFGV